MAALGVVWGSSDKAHERSFDRNGSDCKLAMVRHDWFKRNDRDTRRGSLPPLYKNQYNSCDKYEKEVVGGETSGYGSDNPNQSPECFQNYNHSGYESSSSRDDRPKWGDKGVGVGKFWQPKEEIAPTNEPPNWVKRGLQDGEIVVSNTSPAESPEQAYEENERPYTGSSSSHQRNTYIRGQNIPIDSVELAERERKRQIAIDYQEAIRQQLEERERKKQEEVKRRIQEERDEELRIEREQEMERRRKEQEMVAMKEKLERERKRKEAIQEAIELAQKEAQLEKMKRKHNINNHKNTNSDATLSDVETNFKSVTEDNHKIEDSKNNNSKPTKTKPPSPEREPNEILEITGKSLHTPRQNNEIETKTSAAINVTEHLDFQNNLLRTNVSSPRTDRTDKLTLVFQAPLENLQNIQYALLVPATPQTVNSVIPVLGPQSDRSSNTARIENRILTPTQYRNRNKRFCDSSTQTDDPNQAKHVENIEIFPREKIELTYDNRLRKERRSRSESLEERPKWGANRPPTRYVKQSEKDPLYQRRKLRQKIRDPKSYDDRLSSDESQSTSTRYRAKEKRGVHRKNDQMLPRDMRSYRTEIIPLESDKDQLYYKRKDCVCRCGRHRCHDENLKVDLSKVDNSPRRNVSDLSERLPHMNNEILNRLSSLHNGLLIKQEQWDNHSASSLSSTSRQ